MVIVYALHFKALSFCDYLCGYDPFTSAFSCCRSRADAILI